MPPSPDRTLRCSVVIPTFRRIDLLGRCLDAVLGQRFDRAAYEVIVVDDGHDAATRAFVNARAAASATAGGPALRYLRPTSGRGPAVARNCGWRDAGAPLIAFTDDDTIPDAAWLERGVAAMDAMPACSALCGRVEVPRDPARRPTDHAWMTIGLETAEFVTANAFVRRAALLRIDGFDERFKRAWREDSDLQFRLMQQVGPVDKCGDALVRHPVRPEPFGLSLRQQRNAYFDALLYKKHPRLYRERIHAQPPWAYYAIVLASLAAPGLFALGAGGAAAAALAIAAVLVLRFAVQRLARSALDARHVAEMLYTSALIPFLSVYWRLRGALHFRVLFW